MTMEFQLTHVALVGARITAFHPYGIHSRSELVLQRVTPACGDRALPELPGQELRSILCKQLPLWIHNILFDNDFPGRERLLMPLRRFEGELHDNRDDTVVSAVLSSGFRNQALNPLDLPNSMPMRQRCALVMQIGVWQEAYRRMEQEVLDRLVEVAPQLQDWLDFKLEPLQAATA
jgi:hypothetical protein